MKHVTLLLALSLVCSACAAPSSDDQVNDTSSSEAALSSQIKLEKSRIEVLLDQTNAGPADKCSIVSTKFRVSYENASLPKGTTVVLHAGENFADQQWIGDGFGWGPYRERYWGKTRDLAMTNAGSKWSAETTASPYAQYSSSESGGFVTQYGASIKFVFKLTLPSGEVVWDNRLGQDYSANGNGPACPGGTTGGFILRSAWGPF